MFSRRQFICWLSLATVSAAMASPVKQQGKQRMYGLIGKIECQPGQREALAKILLTGIAHMPGCISYIVANDNSDEDSLWISEVWQDQSHHQASITLPSVQQAIQQGRPLTKAFAQRFETTPLGGTGL